MAKALTDSKIPGFDVQWDRSGPHYEVWYGKVDVPGDRALWFRYKTLDGKIQEASSWAVWFDGDDIIGGKNRWWLDEVKAPGPPGSDKPETDFGPTLRFDERYAVFRVGDAYLDDGNALGSAGPISWDLHWRDSGRRFSYIPQTLHNLGVAQSTYDSCFSDLRVDGRIQCHGKTVEFSDATGMIGHIQGTKIAGHSWAWSHCNNFDGDQNAAFEGLSARALVAGCGSPLMTALVLFVDDHRYAFHGPVQVFRTQSTFDRHRWEFRADNGSAELVGRATAPGDLALVSYIDTDGSNLWCYNTKLGHLELELRDRQRGLDYELRSTGRAAYETLTRQSPVEDVLI